MEISTKLSTEESKRIAGTILMQLGGNKFLAMTGSKLQYCDNYTSCYELRRNIVGAKYMKITLNAMDTYDMGFISLRKDEIKTVAAHKGIYDDMLQSIFTQVTGLNTHL